MGMLKGLVIAMGLAIIVGVTALVTLIAQRAGNLGGAPTVAGEAPGAAAVALPAGARVVESRLEGGRVLLRLTLAGGGERILVVDAQSGRVLSRLDLTRAPGP